jgi:hypothetical protein
MSDDFQSKAEFRQRETAPFELTVFTKSDGPLTKHISLNGDGAVKSDGSECRMSRGRARRARLAGVHDLAKPIFDSAVY